jgi:Uroporphyrinogen decarboxylase (URO-D)
LHDHPELVERVLGAMLEKDREMWGIVAASEAEFVWAPDNVTALVMGPRRFDRYFAPYYESLAETMHRVGKRIYCHIDGATHALVDNIARMPVDIVEAFTPEPTGDLSLADARRAWKDKVLWINFPSSVFADSPDEVASVALELLRQAAPGNGFLLGITENVLDDTLAESLDAVGGVMDRFGECPLERRSSSHTISCTGPHVADFAAENRKFDG